MKNQEFGIYRDSRGMLTVIESVAQLLESGRGLDAAILRINARRGPERTLGRRHLHTKV